MYPHTLFYNWSSNILRWVLIYYPTVNAHTLSYSWCSYIIHIGSSSSILHWILIPYPIVNRHILQWIFLHYPTLDPTYYSTMDSCTLPYSGYPYITLQGSSYLNVTVIILYSTFYSASSYLILQWINTWYPSADFRTLSYSGTLYFILHYILKRYPTTLSNRGSSFLILHYILTVDPHTLS